MGFSQFGHRLPFAAGVCDGATGCKHSRLRITIAIVAFSPRRAATSGYSSAEGTVTRARNPAILRPRAVPTPNLPTKLRHAALEAQVNFGHEHSDIPHRDLTKHFFVR